jgi:hypothetical protein
MLKCLLFVFTIIILSSCKSTQPELNSIKHWESSIVRPTDTLEIRHVSIPPVVDGAGIDKAWDESPWYPINQVWIPYGVEVDSTIFYGRYKIIWSETTNLLYILAEITDDVFVGGHQYHPDPVMGRGYTDHDILEIFIDENKSGERHVFDGAGPDTVQWGSNAEAAFAYHITIDTPHNGEIVTNKRALDIAGTSWSNYIIADYQDHIPDFAVKRDGNHYTWELSLKVFNDSYDHSTPHLSRVILHEGKVVGFSVAYCNNDDPKEEPKKRDHFFGSVWVPEENYNDHWRDASFFGTIQLIK